MPAADVQNAYRDALALLLARLDGDTDREHEVLTPWVEADKNLGHLLAALAEIALSLGSLGRSDEQLRAELRGAVRRIAARGLT